jgi:hypothetical protein
MIGASWLAPSAQSSETPEIAVTFQSSKQCPGAPKWHMAMLEFFENSTVADLELSPIVGMWSGFY